VGEDGEFECVFKKSRVAECGAASEHTPGWLNPDTNEDGSFIIVMDPAAIAVKAMLNLVIFRNERTN